MYLLKRLSCIQYWSVILDKGLMAWYSERTAVGAGTRYWKPMSHQNQPNTTPPKKKAGSKVYFFIPPGTDSSDVWGY